MASTELTMTIDQRGIDALTALCRAVIMDARIEDADVEEDASWCAMALMAAAGVKPTDYGTRESRARALRDAVQAMSRAALDQYKREGGERR